MADSSLQTVMDHERIETFPPSVKRKTRKLAEHSVPRKTIARVGSGLLKAPPARASRVRANSRIVSKVTTTCVANHSRALDVKRKDISEEDEPTLVVDTAAETHGNNTTWLFRGATPHALRMAAATDQSACGLDGSNSQSTTWLFRGCTVPEAVRSAKSSTASKQTTASKNSRVNGTSVASKSRPPNFSAKDAQRKGVAFHECDLEKGIPQVSPKSTKQGPSIIESLLNVNLAGMVAKKRRQELRVQLASQREYKYMLEEKVLPITHECKQGPQDWDVREIGPILPKADNSGFPVFICCAFSICCVLAAMFVLFGQL